VYAVKRKADSILVLDCSCNFTSRFAMACRHLFSVLLTRGCLDRAMYDMFVILVSTCSAYSFFYFQTSILPLSSATACLRFGLRPSAISSWICLGKILDLLCKLLSCCSLKVIHMEKNSSWLLLAQKQVMSWAHLKLVDSMNSICPRYLIYHGTLNLQSSCSRNQRQWEQKSNLVHWNCVSLDFVYKSYFISFEIWVLFAAPTIFVFIF